MLLIFLLSKSSSVNLNSLLIPILFLPREATPGETHFSTPKFIKENFLGKNACLHVTNGRRSDHGNCVLNVHAPDSNFKLVHQTLSAELFLFLKTLCF